MANNIKLLKWGELFSKSIDSDRAAIVITEGDITVADRNDLVDALNLVSADFTLSTVTVSSTPYTVLSTDDIVLVDDDTINAAATVNLPLCSSLPNGFTVGIKKIGSSFSVTIDPAGSDTIDGGASAVLTTPFEAVKITSNGSHWYIF